jgi:hypothetical protein
MKVGKREAVGKVEHIDSGKGHEQDEFAVQKTVNFTPSPCRSGWDTVAYANGVSGLR